MPAAKPKTSPLADKIDELGMIDAEVARLRAKEERARLLRKEIVDLLGMKRPNETRIAEGAKFSVLISEQSFERSVADKPRIFVMLGKDRYIEQSTIGLGKLDELLTADQRLEVITSAQTGPRKIKTLAKMQQKAA